MEIDGGGRSFSASQDATAPTTPWSRSLCDNTLCDAVLAVFADIPNRERKAELARICAAFGLKNVIVDGGYKQKLPEDDIEIIEQFTGKITS